VSDEQRDGAGDGAGSTLDEPPPFLGRWGRIYLLVTGLLVANALVFGLLTWWAS
jgi:hypothetical protein